MVIEFILVNSVLLYVSRVLSLSNPEMIPTRIKIPPTRKRINALVFRSPHKKKFGASDDTKIKYPPNASNTKAENKMNFLKNNSIFWDMGGQTTYREVYMQYQDVYFDATDLLIYVIDIQDPERFENSLEYLDAILTFFTKSKMDVPLIITFHKYDPDLRGNEEILRDIDKLRTELLEKYSNFKILFQQTSIFDIISIVYYFC